MLQWWHAVEQTLVEHWVAWAFFAGYLALTWLLAALATRLARVLLPRLTARSQTTLDDRLAKAGSTPVRFAVLALGLRLSLESLGRYIPSFRQASGFLEAGAYAEQFDKLLLCATALVILAVTALINGLVKAILDWYLHELAGNNGATWDREILPMAKRLASMLIYFLGISVIFESFGYPVTALITTAGVASLAVALAAQETLSNMIGGFVLLVDRPFRVGDVIELADGKMGEVMEVGIRSTRIRQFDGNALVVPNKEIASSQVINLALPTPRVAIRQTLSVAFGTDLERAKEVILGVLQAHPEVLADPAPAVWFTKINTYSLDLFMSCWIETYRNRARVTDELNMALLKVFRENGILVPYPQQGLHLYQQGGEPGRERPPFEGEEPGRAGVEQAVGLNWPGRPGDRV